MLNPHTKQRELAYVVRIQDIEPIEGSDNCECAVVKGWKVLVRKDIFCKNALAIYFEIDSKLDINDERFAFLKPKKGCVKTQKYTFGGKGNFVSQGLLMSAESLGGSATEDVVVLNGRVYSEGDFLTSELGVTYAVAEDNIRKRIGTKRTPKESFNILVRVHPELFGNKFISYLTRFNWFKKLLTFIYREDIAERAWPDWVVKTDEERCQNLNWSDYAGSDNWTMTEKIDGTSATFSLKRNYDKKSKDLYSYYVCSRNVVMNTINPVCFYTTNVYEEISNKYNIYNILKEFLDNNLQCEWITLQGEIYGPGIQKRDYSKDNIDVAMFNLIDSDEGRWNSRSAANYMRQYNIPWVPILEEITLPNTVDEMLQMADGESVIDGKIREGIVMRSSSGSNSFKAVSNKYLLEYHS